MLLRDSLDEMGKCYIADTRKVADTIGSDTVSAAARGMFLNLGKSKLAEFGGPVTLNMACTIAKDELFTRKRKYQIVCTS